MPGSFKAFAEVCERIRSTSKKLEKVRVLSDYLSSLSRSDLPIACRFLTGSIFPKGSKKEVYVGYSTIVGLILEVSGGDDDEFRRVYLKYGDLGFTAEELLAQRAMVPLFTKAPTLEGIQAELERMASITGHKAVEHRKEGLRGLLLDSSPLEARYLIKILTGEMRIGLVEGLVEEAISKAFGHDLEEVRRAQLVMGDVGVTALLASEKRLHEAKMELMRPLSFMLAETMLSPEEIEGYFNRELYAEFKYDGVRAQVHKRGKEVAIYSRRLESITPDFPEVVKELQQVPHDFVLDGEIIPFMDEGPMPFHELQKRLRRKVTDEILMREVPVVFFAYDLLYLDGRSLLDETFEERRKLLEALELRGLLRCSYIQRVKTAQEISLLFEKSRGLGYEGLVLKEPNSPYTPGKRGKRWVKLKRELDTLDVVIVATEYGHGKRAGLYSDYTFAVKDGEELKVVGKAYSGLTDEEILEMTRRLKGLTIEDRGALLIVRPEVVLEVAFDSVQKSSRHNSGYALRFPRIKRIRYDKAPSDIDTIGRVDDIYHRQRTKH